MGKFVYLGVDFGCEISRLQLFVYESGRLVPFLVGDAPAQGTLENRGFSGATDLIKSFLLKFSTVLEGLTIAAIGYGSGGYVRGKEGFWVADAEALSQELGVRAVIGMTNIEVRVFGLNFFGPMGQVLLSNKTTRPRRCKKQTLITAGQYFRACIVEEVEGFQVPFGPAEIGQMDFAAGSDPETASMEVNYLAFLRRCKLQPPEVARVTLSLALNLRNVYEFLRDGASGSMEHEELRAVQGDPTGKICELAVARKCELCDRSLAMYLDMFGRAIRGSVLAHGAFDACYVCGYVLAKITSLRGLDFMKERLMGALLKDVGYCQADMDEMAVWLVDTDGVATWGAAFAAVNYCHPRPKGP